jgi:predicted nucleotidyltransferase
MNKRRLIKLKQDQILAIGRKYGVSSIRVFGSIARGDDTPTSDIDFLVELEPGRSLFDLGGLQVDLEEALNCQVDVVTKNGLRDRIRKDVLEEAVAL